MDIDKLRTFLHIVDAGSVQGASRRLSITRSFLRRSLEALEEEAGARLLHRDSRGVSLTPAGAILADRGRALVAATDALVLDLRSAAGAATGVLRVFEPVGMPLGLRVAGLLGSHASLPNLRLVIRSVEDPMAHQDEPFELMLHDGPPPDRAGWFSRVLVRPLLRVHASQSYLDARGVPTRWEELVEHDVLCWQRPRERTDSWPLLDGGLAPIRPWLTSGDPMLLEGVARGGGGLLLSPQHPSGADPSGEPLVTVLEGVVGTELVLRVSSPYASRSDSRVRDSLAHILEQLEGLPVS